MNSLLLKILTAIAYFLMVGANYLAVSLPLGGRSTGEISDLYANLFAPAGFTFSIWGLIYTLLGIYIVYQFTRTKDKIIARINRIFIFNALANALWIVAWHYDFIGLSLLIMTGLLISLIRIADICKQQTLPSDQKWLVRLPFSVYFGWITVATIANVTVLLVKLGWDGFGLPASFWTVAILLVGAFIGSWRLLYDRVVSYGLVLMWAYGGILAKHLSDTGFAGRYPEIIATVIFCLIVFSLSIIYIVLPRTKFTVRPQKF